MLIDQDSDLHREYVPQVIAFVRQYVKDERLIGKITEETFLAFETGSAKIQLANKNTLSTYLRLTAKRLVDNYR